MRCTDRHSSQFGNNCSTETFSGLEAGSYLRLIDFAYHSTLGVGVIKKKRESCYSKGRPNVPGRDLPGWSLSKEKKKDPVKARFWPLLEPFSLRESLKPPTLFPPCSTAVQGHLAHNKQRFSRTLQQDRDLGGEQREVIHQVQHPIRRTVRLSGFEPHASGFEPRDGSPADVMYQGLAPHLSCIRDAPRPVVQSLIRRTLGLLAPSVRFRAPCGK